MKIKTKKKKKSYRSEYYQSMNKGRDFYGFLCGFDKEDIQEKAKALGLRPFGKLIKKCLETRIKL